MDTETLSFWADVSAIFILGNVCLLTLATGVGLGFGWWYLRKGRKALGMPLLMAQVYALRIQSATMQVTDRIAAVPTEIAATSTQITTTARVLFNSLARAIKR